MADFDIQALRDRLDELMGERNIARKPLAKNAGLGETAIRDIFDPKRHDVRVGTLVKLADYFETSVDDLIEPRMIQLGGRIGAGGEVVFSAEDGLESDKVPRPPRSAGSVLALLVVGASMLPKFEDGDIVYVKKDEFPGIRKEYIGEYCAVRLSDGGTYLKRLTKGSERGRYTLQSLNAPDMENVEVEWAAPIRWVRHKPATP